MADDITPSQVSSTEYTAGVQLEMFVFVCLYFWCLCFWSKVSLQHISSK